MDNKDMERLTSRVNVKGNWRYITICDNVPEHWDSIIEIAKSCYEFYAYIYHDKDDGVEKHLHILCYDKGGTTLKTHADRFSSVIPSNFVLKVKSPRAMARYLIHKDQSDKFQYDKKLVVTNQPDKFAHFLLDPSNNVVDEFKDFVKLMNGQVSIYDYLDLYRGEFSTMPFYQKQAFFHKIVTSSYYTTHLKPPLLANGTGNNNNN